MRKAHQYWVVAGSLLSIVLYTSFVNRQHQASVPCLQDSMNLQPPALRGKDISLSDGTLTFHLDRSIYEDLFPELQYYQCRELVSQDDLCQGEVPGGPPLLLLAIKSHPASSNRRAALRRTWAQPRVAGGFRLKYVFLMATSPDARHANLVKQEINAIGDILMWDFVESHHKLSLKERCFLQWLQQHCQQATYVFKGDDDLFVNIEALTEYLNRTPNASEFIHGNIQYHSTVVRTGKYAVSPAFYPMNRYPHFASGGGFIMPRTSISKLYKTSLCFPVFPLDDVYLGFLALAAGVQYQHNNRFRVWGPPKDEFEVYRNSVVVHGLSMERIEQVWKEIQKPVQPSNPGH
ncbi:UDP-GlcNAc:betaGal beta-1,3-N-acetylglucosaminyltransferase 9-like isoform X2 [Sceloporus undulatus]|nr:UDP-GlcNAc:betaGal beta-1,3-N-acetylglucosaminyltransferase 9-like isoform X2 [Sceloporus undulatus]XP_042331185.1 UDP-GlcNAc:betaGal beta-1,3-N-acetylglucosaminyltransferase 9-like isoform X2 [Sceloporus undulatus]XP_042331186.1 UDP-GlcNAc:betaGal beta-1,3-N-acetylglucosaminyltransferase 9-like isoform X2 [Sceloporus undulatus]XP_042331188.1 UDP-GlcNAc:betaGal beta-1,3-N-acetylglucosaminyltransferase 9-like isoform X2 [Sceloporus undulatus]